MEHSAKQPTKCLRIVYIVYETVQAYYQISSLFAWEVVPVVQWAGQQASPLRICSVSCVQRTRRVVKGHHLTVLCQCNSACESVATALRVVRSDGVRQVSETSKPSLGSTQSCIKWIPRFLPGGKATEA
jgi:hypothetical protein